MSRRSARTRPPRPVLRDDDRGAIQVFEAVLVALLILSTLLIVNALQRPTTAREIGGVDLGQLSADTLDILKDRTFTQSSVEYTFPEWVAALMGQDIGLVAQEGLAAQVHEFLGSGSNGVLPLGTQYQVRVDNGVGHVRMLPPDLDRTPLAARAASAYVFPDWTAQAGNATDLRVRPGAEEAFNTGSVSAEAVDFSTWSTLRAPTGSTYGPDGRPWLQIWEDAEPAKDRIPESALYGLWEYDDGSGGCPCYLEVTLPDGSPVERPLYAVQLVVWYGA